jgi:carboxylesterase
MSEDPRLLPFDLGQGEEAVLLIHGFTGTPYEMRYLGEQLASRGYRVKGVRLTGHGLDPLAFEKATADDWVRDCREAFDSLSGARRVFVAGLSMGALLAVLLAVERPERVSGIALLAPAYRFHNTIKLFLWLCRPAWVRRLVRFVPKGGTAVFDAEERRKTPNLGRVPTLSGVQFAEIIARSEAALPRVHVPALVVYSALDPTVAPRAARLVEQRIGSRPVRTLRLTRSFHLITIDRERDRVVAEVDSFFRGIAAPAAAANA